MHETTIVRLLQQLEEGHEIWVENPSTLRVFAKNFTTGFVEMVVERRTIIGKRTPTFHELSASSVRVLLQNLGATKFGIDVKP